jgi:hypothetical protein
VQNVHEVPGRADWLTPGIGARSAVCRWSSRRDGLRHRIRIYMLRVPFPLDSRDGSLTFAGVEDPCACARGTGAAVAYVRRRSCEGHYDLVTAP